MAGFERQEFRDGRNLEEAGVADGAVDVTAVDVTAVDGAVDVTAVGGAVDVAAAGGAVDVADVGGGGGQHTIPEAGEAELCRGQHDCLLIKLSWRTNSYSVTRIAGWRRGVAVELAGEGMVEGAAANVPEAEEANIPRDGQYGRSGK